MREFKRRKRQEHDEDPSRFVVRNLELANVWEQYDQDRKKLMSQYNHEKQERARLAKEARSEEERAMKIVKAKRWETYREDQKVLKEKQERLEMMQMHKRVWLAVLWSRKMLWDTFSKFDRQRTYTILQYKRWWAARKVRRELKNFIKRRGHNEEMRIFTQIKL